MTVAPATPGERLLRDEEEINAAGNRNSETGNWKLEIRDEFRSSIFQFRFSGFQGGYATASDPWILEIGTLGPPGDFQLDIDGIRFY